MFKSRVTWENSPDCGITPPPYGISLLTVGYWVELNWTQYLPYNQQVMSALGRVLSRLLYANQYGKEIKISAYIVQFFSNWISDISNWSRTSLYKINWFSNTVSGIKILISFNLVLNKTNFSINSTPPSLLPCRVIKSAELVVSRGVGNNNNNNNNNINNNNNNNSLSLIIFLFTFWLFNFQYHWTLQFAILIII